MEHEARPTDGRPETALNCEAMTPKRKRTQGEPIRTPVFQGGESQWGTNLYIMNNDLLLQHLRDLPLEEGKAYIQEHAGELGDYAAVGVLIADEARHQLYTPFLSLKLAEMLIFFGEYVHHISSHALGLKVKDDARNLYTMGLLHQKERQRIANHLVDCQLCSIEIEKTTIPYGCRQGWAKYHSYRQG